MNKSVDKALKIWVEHLSNPRPSKPFPELEISWIATTSLSRKLHWETISFFSQSFLMQHYYIFTSFCFHMFCVTSVSCDSGNSFASKDVVKYALLLYCLESCLFTALQTKEINGFIKSCGYVFPRILSKWFEKVFKQLSPKMKALGSVGKKMRNFSQTWKTCLSK